MELISREKCLVKKTARRVAVRDSYPSCPTTSWNAECLHDGTFDSERTDMDDFFGTISFKLGDSIKCLELEG